MRSDVAIRPQAFTVVPVVNILEPQRPAKQPLLQRTLDGALDILPNRTKADGIRIVTEDGRLLLDQLA